jgi:thiol-disulfide isomerase/thioredoxin
LKDKGAIFYGSFWCPHCQAQKKLFGDSVKLLPYVECSTPDGNAQTQICIDKKITGYPTWKFADGSELTGEIPLATLADKTACTLPTQ